MSQILQKKLELISDSEGRACQRKARCLSAMQITCRNSTRVGCRGGWWDGRRGRRSTQESCPLELSLDFIPKDL